MATASVSKMPTTPSASQSKKQEDIDFEVKSIIGNLNDEWSLELPIPEEVASPEKRGSHKEQRCFNMIYFLVCKNEAYPPVREFVVEAERLYIGWVSKPKAERGVVPESTRHKKKPVTAEERVKLLHVLYTLLSEKADKVKSQHAASPLRWRQTPFESKNSRTPNVDDSPLPFPKMKPDSKRQRDDQSIEPTSPKKKVKTPDKEKAEALATKSANAMLPPPRGRPIVQEPKNWRSANTSFESNATSAVFSNASQSFSRSRSRLPDTQETVPDLEDLNVHTQEDPSSATVQKENHTSSEFGVGSSFEAALAQTSDPVGLMQGSEVDSEHVDDELSQDLLESGIARDSCGVTEEDNLQERLEGVFLQLPPCLDSASFRVKYEILRCFLNAGVSLTGVNFPSPDLLDDYDGLWRFLKNVKVLKDSPLPEKSDKVAWDSARGSFACGDRTVVLSGSLKFDESSLTGPLYRFKLKPMKLDLSYRLSRRLGSHRFLEIDMPHLTDPAKMMNGYPQILRDLGDRGLGILLDWLVDGNHSIFGRYWKPFSTKPKEKRSKKREDSAESKTSHCVYFFAVDGYGIDIVDGQPGGIPRSLRIDITTLLDMIRLTRKNTHQPIFKLFSRTSLALSKTIPTVILEPSQIRYRDDIMCNGKEMTDGAGRMSVALAERITEILKLSFRPSGFQGRIGEAKGFWSIDYSDRSGLIWIDVYQSQCKWVRSKAKKANRDMDPSNRTFEVLNYSRPLKAADLNFQLLPLLVERAINPALMKESLAGLLKLGLNEDLNVLSSSMDNPKALRKWTAERNPNFKERLKAGIVPFRAGLPISLEDQLNMMLENGFQPKKLKFVADIAIQLFTSQCEELKTRLNIPVCKSAYAYMVPDFDGVLEYGEVQINFSNFVDKSSGFSDEILSGQELLVARSPAHFVSDVQKVKAVWREKLMRYKDVILFSTKGRPNDDYPSLASKLSGGDYDGDMAWVCWEPAIVDNFRTAEVPEPPDLVKEGYIRKDSTKYEALAKETPNRAGQTSLFLKKSFAFNMQQSMLGIATNYKDKICYSQGSVGTLQAMQLSSLLSYLVDAAKQGYSFNDLDFRRFKVDLILPFAKPVQPEHSKDNRHLTKNCVHVIDYLMFVAQETVDDCLARFHSTFPEIIPQWDDDLNGYYRWAKNEATTDKDWVTLLSQLDEDLTTLKKSWGGRWAKVLSKPDDDIPTSERIKLIMEYFELYQAIQPRSDSVVSRFLLASFTHSNASQWTLLKASALAASYPRRTDRKLASFPWYMAGERLGTLKANCSSEGPPRTVIQSMYAALKPDNTFINKFLGVGQDAVLAGDEAVSNVDELEATQADN